MSNKGKYYLTTAIAYTSGKPHIGNVYEIVLADAIARCEGSVCVMPTYTAMLPLRAELASRVGRKEFWK